jgi:ribulose-phosphate 3-epimerase
MAYNILMPTRTRDIEIVPSILSADFARLGEQVREAEQGGADRIQVDVMDGHYVPNITIGPPVIEAIRPYCSIPIEAHLMISQPELYISEVARAGADYIIVHVETSPHLHRTIQQIRDAGKGVGVALNPSTPIVMLEEVVEYIDLALVMTVNPGFGGQDFIYSMLPKLRRLRDILDDRDLDVDIEVDGGIGLDTIAAAVDAGANVLVAGSAVYGRPEGVAEAIRGLRGAIEVGTGRN